MPGFKKNISTGLIFLLLLAVQTNANTTIPIDYTMSFNDSLSNSTCSANLKGRFTLPPTQLPPDSLYLVLDCRVPILPEITLNDQTIHDAPNLLPQNYIKNHYLFLLPKAVLKQKNQLNISLLHRHYCRNIFKGDPIIYSGTQLNAFRITEKKMQNHPLMPFSNGLAVANFDTKNFWFSDFYPQLYYQYDETEYTEKILDQIIPELYRGNKRICLKNYKTDYQYIQGTGIISISAKLPQSNISLFGFSPFSEKTPLWIFYFTIEGKNYKKYTPNFKLINPSDKIEVKKEFFSTDNKKWSRLIVHYNENSNFSLAKYKNLNTDFDILNRELKWWKKWHRDTKYPIQLTPGKMALYLQSLVMIKMAQSRARFPAKGQLVSSFPPGHNMTNLYDQSVAIDALLESGHTQEAQQGLQFLLNSRCGKYKTFNFFGNNIGLLNDYALSVNNYLGKGVEMPINTEYPIINLAGFGYTLMNIRKYIEKSEDQRFLDYYWEKIYRKIALVLVNLIDETGLIRAESGPFRQILPGCHFASTSAITYSALIDVAWMARMLGHETAAQEFDFYASKIRINLQNKFYNEDKKLVRSTLEGRTKDTYIDASITALTDHIFTPQDKISEAVFTTIKNHLSTPMKNLIYSKYEIQSIDREISLYRNLSLAESYFRMKKEKQGDRLLRQIINTVDKNAFIIPRHISTIFYHSEGPVDIRSHAAFIQAVFAKDQ